ncbi:MAG: chemotaxis protein CheD [Desulfovibrionales bacterium]|jgi:chemotaxis protein CheD|nr:chemotaxis protein CheD [Desulfovibrionales bacterium]
MMNILLEHPDLRRHFLQISEGCVFTQPTAVSTVLGSCVSVTFFCRSTRIGGVFHALLPESSLYRERDKEYTPYRYVDTAVEKIVQRMKVLGARSMDIEAKVFGGASTLQNGVSEVGRNNVASALAALEREGFVAAASDVGGTVGRRLLFFTHTGDVYIRRTKGS